MKPLIDLILTCQQAQAVMPLVPRLIALAVGVTNRWVMVACIVVGPAVINGGDARIDSLFGRDR